MPEKLAKHEKSENTKKKRRPLRILLVLILILILGNAGAAAYLYKTADDSLAVEFSEENPSVGFGEKRASMDYIKTSEGDVTAESEFLDTSSTGDHQMTYTAGKSLLGGLLNPSKEFILNYTVTDEIEPLMIRSGDGAVLERGTEFDINNVIAYGDNADPEPALKVDGEVNMDKTGSYPLHVAVTDESGNKTEWDLTVEVADSLPAYEDNVERVDFSDFKAAYRGDGRMFGIDVSEWQSEIDFKAVKDAGCEFVMIRIGYGSGGDETVDSQFAANIKGAREAGLKTGLYFYSYDNTEDGVRRSTDWIIENLNGEKLDLPIAFDWEDFEAFQTYKMNFANLNSMYDAFADELKAAGYDCMLYGSKVYLEKVWADTDTRPVWLAHYTDKTDYKHSYRIWQASSTGRIKGINGDVDMDILYED